MASCVTGQRGDWINPTYDVLAAVLFTPAIHYIPVTRSLSADSDNTSQPRSFTPRSEAFKTSVTTVSELTTHGGASTSALFRCERKCNAGRRQVAVVLYGTLINFSANYICKVKYRWLTLLSCRLVLSANVVPLSSRKCGEWNQYSRLRVYIFCISVVTSKPCVPIR
jgi:hypothetical protein